MSSGFWWHDEQAEFELHDDQCATRQTPTIFPAPGMLHAQELCANKESAAG